MTNVELTVDRLQKSVAAMQRRCSSRRLQMNPDKTDFIWLGSRTNLQIRQLSLWRHHWQFRVMLFKASTLYVTLDSPWTANSYCRCWVMLTKSLQLASITPDDWNKYEHSSDRMLIAAKLVTSLLFSRNAEWILLLGLL